MRLVRYLQHWLGGTGPRLQVTDFVPDAHPIRQWADTFPWPVLVAAIEQHFATRFPKRSNRGRAPVPVRVLLALELLKHELGGSDEAICHRLRTDFAVMYACGLREYHADRAQTHFVLPETLGEFLTKHSWMNSSPSNAMDAGLVVPPIWSSTPFLWNKAVNAQMPPRCIRLKKTLELIAHIPHI